MVKFLFTFALLCCIRVTLLYGQSITEKQFGVEINNNKDGYGFIDSILGDKKLVLLGELDHGDGTSFIVKTDLIKYLHENHNFNTLAFEASFINCNFLWNVIGDSTNFKSKLKNSLYYIWSEVEETKNLFCYIEEQYQKGTPLKIVGIDPQFSGAENAQEFICILKNSLPLNITESKQFAEFVHELEIMSAWMVFPKKKQHQLSEYEFMHYCDELYEAISKNHDQAINLPLWKMYIDNVKIMGKIKQDRTNLAFEIRDKQMFENINYWLQDTANEKMIVWAANAHIIRKDNVLEQKGKKFYLLGLKKMGDYLYENYPNSLYAIGITSGKGSTLNFSNPISKNVIKNPDNNSAEGLLHGKKTCFVDLKLFENSMGLEKYASQLFYTNIICTAKWSQHLDGLIYIPEMRPSTPLWQNNKR
ncbi:MAG TPA: erythromycin esterase family protein [Chitinophagales bacterium]|nr:erythromycin esterase family protein [Chitinophagales bacterium]